MRNKYLFRGAVFFAAVLVTHWSAAQGTAQNTQISRTVGQLGTEKSISVARQGQIQYSDQRVSQLGTEIDAPEVSFTFEFTQNSQASGVARVIMASNRVMSGAALELAIDGDLDVTLANNFKQYGRKQSAYKSVVPRNGFRASGVNATISNSVVIDIPVTMSGGKGVLNVGLRGENGDGDAASLFLLRENNKIYAGVQGFMFLQEQALEEKLIDQGAAREEIDQQLKKLRSKPGSVEVKITPPPTGHVDTDPFNSIVVSGQIQFTDINGNTFPVQDADVEIYDVNGAAEVLMDSGTTDNTGNYSITVQGVDTASDGTGPDILVRSYPRGALVRVHMADGGAVYTMDSPVQSDVVDDSSVNINMTAGNDESTVPGQVAYEVYEANRFFAAFISSVNGSPASQLLVEYPRSAAGDGSSYTPSVSRLNLAISDGHDWDNIQHEYGHHAANDFNLANNPGGPHSSIQNSCIVRPSKDEGLRLAWGEGWPTAYSIIAQNEQNLASLGIPNLGDTAYTDTKPVGANTNYDIETGTSGQIGEATERAIMRLMWDTYDAVDDGADVGVSYSAQSLWDAGTASNPETLSKYWAQVTALFSEAENFASGGTLTREGFGANLTNPAIGTTYSGGAAPNFSWTPNLPCDSGGNGRYSVHFQHQGTGALLFASPFQSGTTFTPSTEQLEQIFVPAGGNINWSVVTRDITAPQTGDYYSESRNVVDDFDVPDRDPVDIVLVLDLSSSMNSTPPDGGLPKIDVLQQAVELFINTWNVHSIDDDRLGLIYFNDNTSSVAGTPPAPVLNDVAASALSYISDVNSKSGSGCTAVGGALQEAFNNFDNPDRNKFVLLFSDGIQNVNPFVGDDGSGALQIQTLPAGTTDFPFGGFFCNAATAQGLDGAAITPDGELLADKDITIHSIGVGVNGADFEDLIEQVSGETGGEHLFTSLPDADLDIFFTNDLVESLKQNTLQVVKTETSNLASGRSKNIKVPVGLSATKLTLAISWKNTSVSTPLTVSVTPPGGAVIPLESDTLGQGHRVLHYDMPINADGMNVLGAGDWQVKLDNRVNDGVPYQFSAIVDEGCFKFDMIRPIGGLRAGDLMPVAISLGKGMEPLLADNNVRVNVSRPAQNRGQLLADWLKGRQPILGDKKLNSTSLALLDSTLREGNPSLSTEKSPYIINQLEMLAFSDPEFVAQVRAQETFSLSLQDDGSEQHGDKVAGDGIYTNLVPRGIVPGNYLLDFDYQATNTCGAITRSEKSSFLVRLATIDPAMSKLDVASVGLGTVDVSITPSDRFGNILGPGYADQVAITYGSSEVSGSVLDNLDGSYTQGFNNVDGRGVVTATVRGEQVVFPETSPPDTAIIPCWLIWTLLLLAVIAVIVYLLAVFGGNTGARTKLLVAAVIAVLLAWYLVTHCL